jgi:hypothetical protein
MAFSGIPIRMDMKLALLLTLLLSPVPGFADDAAAARACPSRYSQLSHRLFRDMRDRLRGRETIGKDIRAAIDDGFETRGKDGKPLPKDWMGWGELSDEQTRLLERLPTLTPEEREAYLKLVSDAHPRSIPGSRFRQFILLGLYDPYSWARLAGDPAKFPTASKMAGQYLDKLAPNMPEKLKEEILTASGAHYEDLAVGLEKGKSAPKQAVDRYFRNLLRGDDLILAAIKSGKSPKDAFTAYFDKVQSYVKGSRFYSADEALDTVKHMQRILRHKVVRGLRGKGGEEPILYVGGGIPNGRATLAHADIDIGGNFDISKVDRRDIEKYVEEHTRQIDPEANLHLMLRTQSPNYWEKEHPVMFKVRASSIEMLVYDRKGNYRTFKLE